MGCGTVAACRSGSMTAINDNECVAASAVTCFNDMRQGFTSGTGCVTASATSCSTSDGFVFDSINTACVIPFREISVSLGNEAVGKEKEALNNWYGSSHATVAAAEDAHTPGTQNTNLATLRTNLAAAANNSSIATATGYQSDGTEATNVTDAQQYQRSRYIYANQPSLDQLGAAFAYIRNDGITADGSNLGDGGQISVISNNRFDPAHPSFTSSDDDARYDTIARFSAGILNQFNDKADERGTTTGFFNFLFGATAFNVEGTPPAEAFRRVRGYVTSSNSIRTSALPSLSTVMGTATFFDISVAPLTVGGSATNLDSLTPNEMATGVGVPAVFTNGNALAAVLDPLARQTWTVGNTNVAIPGNGFVIRGGTAISSGVADGLTLSSSLMPAVSSTTLSAFLPHYLGRRYITGGDNIDFYRLLIQPNVGVHAFGSLPSSADMDVVGVKGATEASMGVLALINGRRDPASVSTFSDLKIATHGIAPNARLRVFSTPNAGNTAFNATDLIYRARDINVLAGTVDGATVTIAVDMSRNIVLLQNNFAHASRVEVATQKNIDDVVGLAGSTIADDYKGIYDALAFGVADTPMQDIYVFAAADARGTQKDAGLLASLAAAQASGKRLLADYSIVAVAAEAAANAYCGRLIAAFCIAAPGSYVYRGQGSDNAYGGGDDTLTAVTTPTSNAAASLVAGGLALLIDVFGDQISTKDIVDRMLSTASTDFDIDGTAGNDYDAARHGRGMLNLEAASRPITTRQFGLTGITDEATAKAVFTANKMTFANDAAVAAGDAPWRKSATSIKISQHSLQVAAADAYARGADAMTGNIDAMRFNLGQGSDISVITNKQFDPTHTEFTSSQTDARYDTLTRFYFWNDTSLAENIPAFLSAYFVNDVHQLAQVYGDGFTNSGSNVYLSFAIPALNDGTNDVAFDTVSIDDFNGDADIRTSLLNVFSRVLAGTNVVQTPSLETAIFGSGWSIAFTADPENDLEYLALTDEGDDEDNNFQHVGRVYGSASNIASYQIVINTGAGIQKDDGTADSEIAPLTLATDAEMGLLALINGLLDPSRSDTETKLDNNTHGIAPFARLNLFTSFTAGVMQAVTTALT